MKDFNKNIIHSDLSIKEGLEKLNELSGSNNLTLFVINQQGQLVGTLTDGDIRRGLLKGKSIENSIEQVMHINFRYLSKKSYTIENIREFKEQRIYILPFLDESGRIINVIDLRDQTSFLPLEAVIMAGGVGERLRPLTEKTPKPLLKVGDKPIIEHNIDRLIKFGIDKITISVNYLGDQIKEYFGDGSSKDISISYVKEEVPCGTIGSITLVDKFDHDTILVLNSDLLTNIDFEDFYKQFEEDKSTMSVASVPYKINVPYAVLEVDDNKIISMKEKPTYTYFSNAGIYLIKKKALNFIPKNQKFHATDLIELLIEKGEKVTTYPILGYWLDIGKYDDFIRAQEDIKHIKF
jgi:dTDP-glucose pyrophosphorylase